jgi:hypothetical protein
MADRYNKTESGRREIRERAQALSRTARNLLLILDASRSGEEWVGMVQGATPADLQALISAGLVETAGGRREAPRAAEPVADPDGDTVPSLAAEAPAGTGLSYADLYASLNALIKEQLGLLKGYRFSLDVEKAGTVPELEEVARRFAEEVRKVKGDTAAQMVRRALGLGR